MLEIKETNETCISCCDKNKTVTKQININRDKGIYKGANIVSFSLCKKCLRKLAMEFKPYS